MGYIFLFGIRLSRHTVLSPLFIFCLFIYENSFSHSWSFNNQFLSWRQPLLSVSFVSFKKHFVNKPKLDIYYFLSFCTNKHCFALLFHLTVNLGDYSISVHGVITHSSYTFSIFKFNIICLVSPLWIDISF